MLRRKLKKIAFLQSNKNCIQIQLYFDEVQLTCPLKTKIHKATNIYLIVRNLPAKFLSKLDNMYLVASCDSTIIDKYGTNCLLKPFIHDLRMLETNGIQVKLMNENNIEEEITLKGTLVNVAFDNLDGNMIFGFVKSFSARFYCRICFCHRSSCQENTKEVPEKIRNIQHYDIQIEKIQSQDQGSKFAAWKNFEDFQVTGICIELKFTMEFSMLPL